LVKRCKRCHIKLTKDDEPEITDGHCYDCYLKVLDEQGEEIDAVGKELDKYLR